jgi:hypothetical protein
LKPLEGDLTVNKLLVYGVIVLVSVLTIAAYGLIAYSVVDFSIMTALVAVGMCWILHIVEEIYKDAR